jgi:nitroreductase
MEFKETMIKRQSIREYEDKPVPQDKLNRILEAARLAPSGSNRQPWKFIVVKDSQRRRELAQAANGQTFVGQAPVIITAVATDPDRIMSCGIPSYAVDLAIAITQMTLAAVDEGLGTCWIGAFSQDKVKEILGVPAKYKVVTVLPVGYPKRESMTKMRKSLEEVVCYEKFKE